MPNTYDAIVVGARCAGASTAMLLARKGHRVLMVDRARFPSDTLSTHVVQPPGVAALARWGLLDRVEATGCPPVLRHSFDFGSFTIRGTPRPYDGNSTVYAPRRTVLDKILVDAAVEAGVELREHFPVEQLLVEEGRVVGVAGRARNGSCSVERARIVIGADGRNSLVAKVMRPREYHTKPRLQFSYYTYWQDLPVDEFEIFVRPGRGFAAVPTNDGLTMVVVGWPMAERTDFRSDVEANYRKTLESVPSFAERIRGATRVERFTGGTVRNFFRTPFGPGWALVGDAGYSKDPITAQGISDAFRQAEFLAAGLDEVFRGESTYEAAMDAYVSARDTQALPMYTFTTELATLQPLPAPVRDVLEALAGNQQAIDDFVGVNAGTVSPAEFFDPEKMGRILAAAPTRDDRATAASPSR